MSWIKCVQYGALWCVLLSVSYRCVACADARRVMLAVVLDVDNTKEFKPDFIVQSLSIYAINYAYLSDNGKQVIGVFNPLRAAFFAQQKNFLCTLRLLDVKRVSWYKYDEYIDIFALFAQKKLIQDTDLPPMHAFLTRDYFEQT